MNVLESILLALSLCADCFAVSLCSSLSLKNGVRLKQVLEVASAFAVIQTGLLLVGLLLGDQLSGFLMKVSNWIGFGLLLYVGGSMIVESLKGEEEAKNLCGMRNIIIGGVSTSIDASAVGVSQSIVGIEPAEALPLIVSVFAVTLLSVIAGMKGGSFLGRRFGRVVEIVGGLVLIGIGVTILLDINI